MDDRMSQMYSDIVKVMNRTDKPLEFRYDSKLHVIEPGKKGKNLPRFIAEHGVRQHATSFDSSGFPTGSLLGIEGDNFFTTEPMTAEEVKTAEDADKFGEEVIDGDRVVKKKRLELKTQKENFSANNLG